MKNGKLGLVNVIPPGFEVEEIATIRVTEMSDRQKEKFTKDFPETNAQSLTNAL